MRSVVHVATESARYAPCPRGEFSQYGTRRRHNALWHLVARSRLEQGLDTSRALGNKFGWKTLHSNIFQRPRSLGDEALTPIPDLPLRLQLWLWLRSGRTTRTKTLWVLSTSTTRK